MLDSTTKVKDLIANAVELNATALAITDHECLAGHVKAIQAMKKAKEAGYDGKLILGNEVYLVDDIHVADTGAKWCDDYYHFILLALDKEGHHQLRELSTLAWSNSFHANGMERVPLLKQQLYDIVSKNKGHLVASTACIGGEFGKRISAAYNLASDDADNYGRTIVEPDEYQHAIDFLLWCKDLFGDNFYLEMQPNDCVNQVVVNQQIVALSEKLNIPYIITCDSHYRNLKMKSVHACYLNSRDEDREVEDFYATTYNMTPTEIHQYMDGQIGVEATNKALEETNRIADKVEEYDLFHETIVPQADIPPFTLEHFFEPIYERTEYFKKYAYSEDVNDRYLLYLIEKGFIEKMPYSTWSKEEWQKHIDRIEIELKEMWLVTEKLHNSISAYYISILELIDIMWTEAESFVGVARGSVTGMLTMYLIGITQMNPMDWGLPHWRHISHEKAELSDVDVDSQRDKRNLIIQCIKQRKGWDRVLNCATYKTEGTKSVVLTVGRSLGIDPDVTSYLANMIPVTRGFSWSLHDCVYGNEEDERKPVTEFINECANYPDLLPTAMELEGLINGRSIHASALYIFNSNFNDYNCMMKAPNGVEITQFNMADSDYCGALKVDILTISALDKIRRCVEMLINAGYMEWQGSWAKTYDTYLSPDKLDYDSKDMWNMVADNSVTDLFQFDTSVGLQAAKKIQPHSIPELAAANSIMRLMVSEEGAEQPMDKYIRFKNDINQWYDEMRNKYHLTEEEIKIVEPYLLPTYGVADTQEVVMKLVMDERICNFNVKESNLVRKSIAKKKRDLQEKMKQMLFERGKELGTSENLLNYVWYGCIGMQLGYSFSQNHTYPYSAIGLQELNLAYHYPIIYWNTACLIVNASADENSEDNKSTNYGKVATAISKMQKQGINIALPLVNSADFGFTPDEQNNRIIYSLKGICGIGDEVAFSIVRNRPYASFDDFLERLVDTKLIQPAQMVKLIKAGCFTELHNTDRKITMEYFLRTRVLVPCAKLTLSQLGRMKEYDIIPQKLKHLVGLLSFQSYVLDDEGLYKLYIDPNAKRALPKCGYNDRWFILDKHSMDYFTRNFTEESIVDAKDGLYIISEKKFTKEVDQKLLPLREWMASDEALHAYREGQFKELWDKHASGTESRWDMEALSIYYGEHELAHIDLEKYSIVDYDTLPEDPVPYDFYVRHINGVRKEMPKLEIVRLAGTVLDTNNIRHTVNLLTHTGAVVTVKLNKGQYSHYSRQISQVGEDGKKHVIDKPWLSRGSLILVCGYRQDDMFRAYRYNDTVFTHTINKIDAINDDGTLQLLAERERA